MKLKGILLTAFLAAGLTGLSFAGLYDDWPDDAICMWLDMKPTHEGYLGEAEKRSLTCEDGKAVAGSAKTSTGSNSTSKTKSKASSIDSDITYDVVFSAAVLKELLNRVVSKTNYDFSKHKLANNDNNSICRFSIRRVVYEDSELGRIEDWDIAKGNINIKGSVRTDMFDNALLTSYDAETKVKRAPMTKVTNDFVVLPGWKGLRTKRD